MVQKAKSMYCSAQGIREAPHNVSADFLQMLHSLLDR